jgi:ABC-2 type transport system permease protein
MSGSLAFFATHEARLAWRDTLAMLAGARGASRRRRIVAVVGLTVFVAGLHLVAEAVVGPTARAGGIGPNDLASLVTLTGAGILAFMMMLSQSLETTTRAFYARADLDLILSSPAASAQLFAVRIAAVAVSGGCLASLIAGPFINVLAVHDGPGRLAGYVALWALAAVAAAVAVAVAVALFRLIGPRRTRAVAQIAAAVIGAAFVIGVQVASILSIGQFAQATPTAGAAAMALAPTLTAPAAILVYAPARAALGDPVALVGVVATGAALLATTIALTAPGFGRHALAAGSLGVAATGGRARPLRAARTPAGGLIVKEWRLILRDPWLMSQTLMQILYLVPPALLLWRNFGAGPGGLVVIVPVVVMAAGQLAGGLAWLALSAEDAPDLVASAPVAPGLVTRAKVVAVIGAVAVVVAPLVAGLALAAPTAGLTAAGGIVAAAAAATTVQLLFRTTARRTQFRRRQTASRLATLLEAFASIGMAAAAALMAAGSVVALVPAGLVALMLALAWAATAHR